MDETRIMQRARKIAAVIFDVDGVLTDGSITIDSLGGEIKRFNAQDGTGIKFLRRSRITPAIITGREGGAVEARAAGLGIEHLYQGYKQKMGAYEDFKKRLGLTDDEIAYLGDDLPDIPVMRACGLAVAVPNARPEVRKVAHIVLDTPGGHGAAREFAEWLLKAAGRWDAIISRYLPEGE
ncbi:MAG: HAD hydrolase family protein [Planctomycetes bacterium]|nr:HAD hydrolase family protein [Planctomycetota bacterium]